MFRRNKKKKFPERTNNIWNRYDFAMCGMGEKNRLIARLKHIKRCLCWSMQRVVRGYSDGDVRNMFCYLQVLIPDMLQYLKDNRHGSPSFLGAEYIDDEGVLVNDTCHVKWDEILDRMIFLWKEMNEDSCSRRNPFDDEYAKALNEFTDRYGFLGERLQTERELVKNCKRGGCSTVHFMDELPEYKDISEKYREKERELEQYRNECKDEAMDMLKKYFCSLWD